MIERSWVATVAFYFSLIVKLKGPACITRSSMDSALKTGECLTMRNPEAAAMRRLSCCEILLLLYDLEKCCGSFIITYVKSCLCIVLLQIVPAVFNAKYFFLLFALISGKRFTAHPVSV